MGAQLLGLLRQLDAACIAAAELASQGETVFREHPDAKTENLPGYAWSILKSRISDQRRKRDKRALPSDLSAFAAVVDSRDDFAAVHGRIQFAEAIGHLSERQRDAVVLRYGLELDTADGAHLMGVAEATVRSFVRQARARLLQVLDIPSDDGKVRS